MICPFALVDATVFNSVPRLFGFLKMKLIFGKLPVFVFCGRKADIDSSRVKTLDEATVLCLFLLNPVTSWWTRHKGSISFNPSWWKCCIQCFLISLNLLWPFTLATMPQVPFLYKPSTPPVFVIPQSNKIPLNLEYSFYVVSFNLPALVRIPSLCFANAFFNKVRETFHCTGNKV